MRLNILTIVLLTLAITAPLPAAHAGRNRLELGIKPYKIEVDGRQRTYRKAVPRKAKLPMPLVLVLHGGGFGETVAATVAGYTDFTKLALREGFVVVYPIGFKGNWNDGRGVDHIAAQKEGVDDVKFLRRVVDDVAKSHPIDRTRIFATGISNGAFMSHRLATEASDLVAGVAPVVGSMSQAMYDKFSPPHPVSLFVIQGTHDPLVPFSGGTVGSHGKHPRGHAVATDKAIARYLYHYGITAEPNVSMLPNHDPDDETVTEARVYPPGKGGVKVQLYVVKNGGHTWPGKRQYLPEKLIGKTSKDFDGTKAIWEFFKSCPPRRAVAK